MFMRLSPLTERLPVFFRCPSFSFCWFPSTGGRRTPGDAPEDLLREGRGRGAGKGETRGGSPFPALKSRLPPEEPQKYPVSRRTPKKRLFVFWGVALTPGASVGITTKPMGGGVGKKKAVRHPIYFPSGGALRVFLLLVPRGRRPCPRTPTTVPVPGRAAAGGPRLAGGSCSRCSAVQPWAARPDGGTLSRAFGSRDAAGVPGSSQTTNLPVDAPDTRKPPRPRSLIPS